MNNSLGQIPPALNEPILQYAPQSHETASLKAEIRKQKNNPISIKPIVNGVEIETGLVENVTCPHEHQHVLAEVHKVTPQVVQQAIDSAVNARHEWMRMDWLDRAAIFLKAAELLATKYRWTINAATMLGQSKNAYQAEIDSACEIIDFLRFNAQFAQEIYQNQPVSSKGVWNRLQYRPLEGFVFAVAPFNFTAISGNLATAPALMGNTVLWKPATSAVLSSYYLYKIFEEAGVPPGVLNFLPGDGADVGNPVVASPHFAGLHFTGSTQTFNHLWKSIGNNIGQYRSYPRIVGETGGKDFVFAHPSANAAQVATALTRGAFEYQGQKCSAASRAYLPKSLWKKVEPILLEQLSELKMGSVEKFSNFVNAVIDEKSYDKITQYIHHAKNDKTVSVIAGGNFSKEVGYFIEPTVILTQHPQYVTMCEELFGPVLTIYLYEDTDFVETLKLADKTSPYALTGSIFAQDRKAVALATDVLTDAAGNFYINDKPTGAVVGQQPFGGGRASGTNDKAGAPLNLLRWVSARTIKETFVAPTHYGYPFLEQ